MDIAILEDVTADAPPELLACEGAEEALRLGGMWVVKENWGIYAYRAYFSKFHDVLFQLSSNGWVVHSVDENRKSVLICGIHRISKEKSERLRQLLVSMGAKAD